MHKGNVVTTNENTTGVITDYDSYAPAVLVRLSEGSELDTSHGRWYGLNEITGTVGFDADAKVWFAGRMTRAGDVTHPMEF